MSSRTIPVAGLMDDATLPGIRFDEMGADELMAFWKRYHRASRRDAAELCGGRFPGYTGVAAAAANYACNLAVAMRCRERGDGRGAEVYGAAARIALESIPERLRPRP